MRFWQKWAVWLVAIAVPISAAAQEPSITSEKSIPELLSETDDYWTEERLREAEPYPMPALSEEEFERMLELPPMIERQVPEAPEFFPSGRPEGALSTEGDVETANVKDFPFSAGGKFFFTKKSNGKDYTCSAEFVSTKRVYMTAAHCVYDAKNQKWHKNFKFKRAYKDGGGQKVLWKCMSIWTSYYSPSTNYAYDYAFVYANKDSNGGWLGYRSGIPYASWTSIGYPANYGSAKKMKTVVGTKGSIQGGVVEMKDNPMGHGSSGGAWIGDLSSSDGWSNFAIGLNSFGYDSQPNSMYGPLFNSSTNNLRDYVSKKGCLD